MGYRLGVDVGGTFTDLLLFEDGSGRSWRHKTPSTPADSSRGVMAGVNAICAAAEISPAAIGTFLHGTTVATNAVLEGKGARVGLITTQGYRQVLQIARSLVPGGLAAWIVWPKPEPMAKLEDSFEVGGRIGADGAEITELNEDDVLRALEALRERGVEAITISLMNAYVNGAHERRVAELADQILPGLPVSMSHVVLPEMQEYERTLTTVANAAMRPVVGRYVRNLRGGLRDVKMSGSIALLRSDGGLMASENAEENPVSLLMSGPAGGVAGALWVARQAALPNILTLDVGGTSTDVALIENYEPRRTRITQVGDLSVRASSLDVKTVGAGGGSIAHVPQLTRALRVGPQSAGAVPGPAAYGKGGTRATVTDANVVLGYLPENLLGGTFRLDRPAALAAVQAVADAMGVELFQAARGIIDIANENMFGALRMISVQQGYDPRDFALMGFGGAGPLHVNAVARLMGSWPAVSPVSPGVLCALGDATTPMRTETARSLSRLRSDVTDAEVLGMLRDMERQARTALESDGVAPADMITQCEIDVRYHGQAFEVPMPVALNGFEDGGLDRLAEAFDAEHRRLFTFTMDAEQEFVNLRVVAMGAAAEIPAKIIPEGDGDPSAARLRDHEMWVDGDMRPGAIYDRSKLRAGDRIAGPAVIVEMDSTTLVLPDCAASVDRFGNIFIRPLDK
jgi:N-methylhydantoinase A